MAGIKPPVIETAVIAWRDAFRAIGAMPVVAGIAFVLALVDSLASFAVLGGLASSVVPRSLANFTILGRFLFPAILIGSSIVQAALFTPLAIAVHRFVLLGENTNCYSIEPLSSRYLRFVGFATLVKIIWLIPTIIGSLISLGGISGIVVPIVFVTGIIIMVRRAILFPAIALDAPGATWSNARLDTKGSSWLVAFIFVLTSLPVLIIGPLEFWLLLGHHANSSTGIWLLFNAIGTAFGIVALCAFAAAASHIYRARADTMTRPSGSPGSTIPASPAVSLSS